MQKYGAPAGAGGPESPSYGIAAPDGSGVFYDMTAPVGDAVRGVQSYAVGRRSSTGWSAESRIPLPSGPVNFIDYLVKQPWPSEDLSTIAYEMGGGGIVPGNPAVPHGYGEPEAQAFYRVGPGGLTWMSEPTVVSPNPALGHIPLESFVGAGGSTDLSTFYFGYWGTLLPEDASRAPNITDRLHSPWGFYRYANGRLEAAGVLPDGTLDPYGAVPAGAASRVSENGNALGPLEFRNQISRDGSRAFFVSPDPRAGSGRSPQLYVRKNGATTVLVSRSAVTGNPAQHGAAEQKQMGREIEIAARSYAYASRDSSHVYFQSVDPLTADAPSDTTTKKAYIFDVDHETLKYLPDAMGDVLAASDDLSRFLYATTPDDENYPFAPGTVGVWADGHATVISTRQRPDLFAALNYVTQGRAAADGSSFVFQSNSPLAGGFNNTSGLHGGLPLRPRHGQAELPELRSDRRRVVTADSVISHYGGSGSTGVHGRAVARQPRHLPGRQASISTRSMRWCRVTATGSAMSTCGRTARCSWSPSGVSRGESNILDSSASGDDVFFATTDGLVDDDRDGEFDVYDARVGGGFPAGGGCGRGVPVELSHGPPAGPPPVVPAASIPFAGLRSASPVGTRPATGAIAKPKVSKVKTVHGTSASLKVQVPGKGAIGVSGSGLASASKQASKAGSYTITARLSKAAQRTLARKRKLVVKVTVRFTPAAGKPSSASVSVTFVPAAARRATVLSSVSRKGR